MARRDPVGIRLITRWGNDWNDAVFARQLEPLSMVATVGHAGAIQAFVPAGMKRHIAGVFAVHYHALSDHA
jgi:hypothetical protein